MYSYELMDKDKLKNVTKEHLASMYNDAVETIWLLERRMKDLQEENDAVWNSYDEISNKTYG